jgi:hypothetical protein
MFLQPAVMSGALDLHATLWHQCDTGEAVETHKTTKKGSSQEKLSVRMWDFKHVPDSVSQETKTCAENEWNAHWDQTDVQTKMTMRHNLQVRLGLETEQPLGVTELRVANGSS